MLKFRVAIFSFFVISVACVSEEMQEVIDMLHNTCQEETGVPEEIIARAQKGDFEDDDRLRCYTKCLMTEMSTIGDDGMIDVEATLALMPDDVRPKMEATVRKCDTQVGVNACDNAYKTIKCYYDNNKEDFFLP